MFQQAGNIAPLIELSIGSLRTPLSPAHVSTILEIFGCQDLTRLDLFDVGDDVSPSQTLSQIAATFPTLESITLLSDEGLGGWPGDLVSNTLSTDPGEIEMIARRGETDTTFARQKDCVRSLQSLSSLRYLCWNNLYGWERQANLDALPSHDRDEWLYNTADPLGLGISSLQEIKFAVTWTRFCRSCIFTRPPNPSTRIVDSSLDFLYPDWLDNQRI